jgi:hypothetical protein
VQFDNASQACLHPSSVSKVPRHGRPRLCCPSLIPKTFDWLIARTQGTNLPANALAEHSVAAGAAGRTQCLQCQPEHAGHGGVGGAGGGPGAGGPGGAQETACGLQQLLLCTNWMAVNSSRSLHSTGPEFCPVALMASIRARRSKIRHRHADLACCERRLSTLSKSEKAFAVSSLDLLSVVQVCSRIPMACMISATATPHLSGPSTAQHHKAKNQCVRTSTRRQLDKRFRRRQLRHI